MYNNFVFKKRILFVGIPDMAYVCLDGLIMSGVNVVGVVGAKKNHPTYDSFKIFVKERDVEFIEYDELDNPFFIDRLKSLNADIAVVCSFNYKVPRVMLDSVKDGFLNVHPSLLPQYRGPNPYTAVIRNEEQETGVTIHFMDESFDTGDIVLQKKIPVSKIETMGTLFNRTNLLAFEMLIEVLREYESGPLIGQKQPQGEFIKASRSSEEDLFIDFLTPANNIESFIRSLNPFILARTTFRGTVVKVLSALVEDDDSSFNSEPVGCIVKIENDKFYVKTQKGLLAITSMQFGGFFAGTSKEFIEILDPRVGEIFGE